MVNLLRSVTWRVIYSVRGAKEITNALCAWFRTEVYLPSKQALESSLRERQSRNSWSRTHKGTAIMVERDKDWWTVEAHGPISRIVIVCSDYRTALKKLSSELDKQCNEYALEQRGPEEKWWDESKAQSH